MNNHWLGRGLRPRRLWLAAALAVAVPCLAVPGLALPATPAGADDRPPATPATPAGAAATASAGEPLTLPRALALALAQSPRLAAADLAVRMRDAEQAQAALRPNPELSLEVENFAGSGALSGFGGAEYTLSLAQVWEMGGKRLRRAEVAGLDGELAGWDHAAARLDVMRDVTRAFVDAVAADAEAALAAELADVASEDLAAVEQRVAAGAATPLEAVRGRVDLATAQMERRDKDLAREATRVRLAATWGDEHAVFGDVRGDLDEVAAPPDLDALRERLDANPDLARWRTELARRRAVLALARAEGRGDLTVAGGLRHHAAADERALVAGVALPLPLHDRNQGAVAAARLGVDQAAREQQAARVAAAAALAAGHAALAAAHADAVILAEEILPAAREAMATAADAYRRGLFSYTDVLAVRATYCDLRLRHIAALARYHGAAADLERLVAGPLHDISQPQERP